MQSLLLNKRLNLKAYPDWFCVGFDTNRYVPPLRRKDKLEKVTIPNEQVIQTAAVDVTALSSELEKRWIHQQLFIAVRLRAARTNSIRPRLRLELSISVDSNVSYLFRNCEDSVDRQATVPPP
jgi:hypothetical protein